MIAVWLLSKHVKYQVLFRQPDLAYIKFPTSYIGESYTIIRTWLVQNYLVAPVILSAYMELNRKFLSMNMVVELIWELNFFLQFKFHSYFGRTFILIHQVLVLD